MSRILIKVLKRLFLSTQFYSVVTGIKNCTLNKSRNLLFSMSANESIIQNKNNIKEKMQSQIDIKRIKNSILEKYNVVFETPPTKSKSDGKEYLVMKLDNGLKALLISDVENLLTPSEVQKFESDQNISMVNNYKTSIYSMYSDHTLSNPNKSKKKSNKKEKLAACCLSVGVGSFSDPEDIPGLAHFLEHMLFMGSKKFPKENDFDSYITARGGSSNAFTANETTSFYFTCPDKHLYSVLDRFANFFISPLLKRESMTREREAVDSEFQQNLFSDSARTQQILCSTAPLNNPAHKFCWGNLISLKENVKDDDVLYNTLREFWKKHYSANLMTVAVQARLPLDILGLWVAQFFGEILSNNSPQIVFPYEDPPFKMDLFNKMYTVMPIEDRNHLQLTWAFPPVRSLYRSKPISYLNFLIDHKGEGSLFSFLYEKLWIIDLQTSSSENNSNFSSFSIDLILTEKGLENTESVVESIFNYIELLKQHGPSEQIFKELQIVEDLEFHFQYENDASDNVLGLSHNMQIYPPVDFITGDELLFEYEPNEIIKIIELMTPGNVNVMILSKPLASKAKLDQIEPWFKTKFKSEVLPKKYLDKWQNCQLNPSFFLPKPNIYIPSVFNIIPLPEELPEYPKKIISNDYIEVWHKQDGKFKLPYGYVVVYLISPIASSSPYNSVMSDIFKWLFSFLIIKETYPAGLAGLHFSLSSGYNGLMLNIDGFSQKIPLLLNVVFKEMINFVRNKNIPEGLFNALKEQLGKEYHNNILDPSQLAIELYSSILRTNFWGSIGELKAINNVTIAKCQEFNANFFDNLYIKCLIQGNISEEQAIDISSTIKETIDYTPLLSGTFPQTLVRVLPKGENIIRVQSFNMQDTNCNVTNYYQYGLCSISDHCVIHLLMLMMEEPLFNTLRTQEQLAYSASCQFRNSQGVIGFSMTVLSQADKFSVEHVENRMSIFLKKFATDLEQTSLEDFNRTKESLKILFLIDDTNLREEVQRNWVEIVSDDYMFDRDKIMIKSLEDTELSHMKLVMNKILGRPMKHTENIQDSLQKLSIQVDGEKNLIVKDNWKKINDTEDSELGVINKLQIKTSNDRNEQHKFIKDIEDFKSRLFIFPFRRHDNK